MSRYDNDYGRFALSYPDSADASSAAAELQIRKNITWPLELAIKALCGADCDCTLSTGFQVSIGAGLSVDVSAGSGLIDGLVIYASGTTNKASLPDDTATIYLFLKKTATTKDDRSFTVEYSLAAPPMADAIYIATCTTSGGSVTVVDNNPASRVPRIPGSLEDIPGLRVVAPAGAEYTDPKTAIEACVAGDCVYVCAGSYTIPSSIGIPCHNIAVIGQSHLLTMLNFTPVAADHLFELNGYNGLRFHNFAVTTAAGNDGYAFNGNNCDDIAISHVKINGADLTRCINFSYVERARITQCYLLGGGQYGIFLHGSSDSFIADNIIDSTKDGSAHGIYLSSSTRVRAAGNLIHLSGANVLGGISATNPQQIAILHNTIRLDDTDAGTNAIHLRASVVDSYYNRIIQNLVIGDSDLGDGIRLETVNPHTLRETHIAENDVIDFDDGIAILDARCNDTFCHGNKVATCTTGVSDAGTNTNAQDQD